MASADSAMLVREEGWQRVEIPEQRHLKSFFTATRMSSRIEKVEESESTPSGGYMKCVSPETAVSVVGPSFSFQQSPRGCECNG